MASLSHGRMSSSEEYGSEAGAVGASGTPSSRADAAEGSSPWEAKSPGDSPRSRISSPGRIDSTSGERRQARPRHHALTILSLDAP